MSKYIRKNHKNVISTFDSKFKFYFVKSNINYVLAIKYSNDTIIKQAYTLDGVIIDSVKDKIINNELVTRKVKNKDIEIYKNKISYVEEKIKLVPIKSYNIIKSKKLSPVENKNIGVIDLETYVNTITQKSKVYAAGLFSNLDKSPITFYIDKNTLDSNKVIYDLIEEMFKYKYRDTKFYCHNLGGFDVLFIIKALLEYKSDNHNIKYDLDVICRKDVILKIEITRILLVNKKKDGEVKNNKISISDSYAILTDSLKNLSIKYDVNTIKGDFPHSFANKDTLFYIGNTPERKHYKGVSLDDYKSISINNWSFKDQSLLYLEKDLYCLYQVLNKANQQLFLLFSVEITDCLTISKIALTIFLRYHYNKNVIPLINNKKLYSDIKAAYYGGITEVYKPYGENLYYYDVNSLYPYAALNSMPGLNCEKLTFYKDDTNINSLFGFFYCKITAPLDHYLGLLPIRVIWVSNLL